MTNLINELKNRLGKEIKDYGISEIFKIDGELYITSIYDLPEELIKKIENEIK